MTKHRFIDHDVVEEVKSKKKKRPGHLKSCPSNCSSPCPQKPNDEITDNMTFDICTKFFEEYGLIRHQLESYNTEVLSGFESIIQNSQELIVDCDEGRYTCEFGSLLFRMPVHKEVSDEVRHVTPMECISRDITYKSAMLLNIRVTDPGGHIRDYNDIHIGSIPVMVMSELCYLDELKHDQQKMIDLREDVYERGGYFIIKGSKKILTCQERSATNRDYTFKNRKAAPKFTYYTEVRSMALVGAHSTTTQVGIEKNGLISVVVPYIDAPNSIPLIILFQALGSKGKDDILRYIITENDLSILEYLYRSFEQSYKYQSQDVCLHYIGRRGKKYANKSGEDTSSNDEEVSERVKLDAISYAKHLMSVEFLPHLGTGEKSFVKKRFYLGRMVKKFLDVILGRRPLDDRDHLMNKHPATAGVLLYQQFFNSFRRLRSEITAGIERCIKTKSVVNVPSLISPKTITSALTGAINNNTWGRNKIHGVSQLYDQFNHIASISNANKLITPMSSEGGKITTPRALHGSHYGVACPSETPEGKRTGLVKTKASSCLITIGSDPDPIREIFQYMNVIPFEELANTRDMSLLSLPKVFINGDLIGVTEYPNDIVKEFRILRRTGGLDPEISLAYNSVYKEISVSTEPGRLCRPLFVVEKGKMKLRRKHLERIKNGEWNEPSVWTNLISKGFVEIIDKAEEESCQIAYYPSDLLEMSDMDRLSITHVEINPAFMYGVAALLIPFSDHNQSPRITYYASMSKQAVGIPYTNFIFSKKGTTHVLDYPQNRLVSSMAGKVTGVDFLPTGQNASVLIGNFQGYNQEDSIIVKQDACELGFGVSTAYLTFDAKIQKDAKEEFEVPLAAECHNFKGNANKLDRLTAVVSEGETVENGDILIGRTTRLAEDMVNIHGRIKSNISVIYNNVSPGKVHAIERGITGDGYEYYRVIIAQRRVPGLGDKFSSSHGQKGTIGKLYRAIDLPFTEFGETPDVIINPLAIPSQYIRLEGLGNQPLVLKENIPFHNSECSFKRRSS